MLPKECVAYSGLEVDGTRVNKTMIQNGYSELCHVFVHQRLRWSLWPNFKED